MSDVTAPGSLRSRPPTGAQPPWGGPAAAEAVLACEGLRKRFHEGDLDVEVGSDPRAVGQRDVPVHDHRPAADEELGHS